MNINARVQVLDWTLDSKPSIALTHVADGETVSEVNMCNGVKDDTQCTANLIEHHRKLGNRLRVTRPLILKHQLGRVG